MTRCPHSEFADEGSENPEQRTCPKCGIEKLWEQKNNGYYKCEYCLTWFREFPSAVAGSISEDFHCALDLARATGLLEGLKKSLDWDAPKENQVKLIQEVIDLIEPHSHLS